MPSFFPTRKLPVARTATRPNPGALFGACGHDGFGEVAGSKSFNETAALGFAFGEPEGVGSDHAAALPRAGGDFEELQVRGKGDCLAGGAGAGGVNPVGFGVILLDAVELGAAAGAEFYGQAGGFGRFDKSPANGVGSRGGLQPGVYGLEVGEAEFLGGEVAFGLIAGVASQGEVLHSVAASAGAGDDVLGFEGHVGLAAIGALAAPFLEQVLADFVAQQGALLVFDSGDVGVFQSLGIEFDVFDGDGGSRGPPAEPLDPGQGAAAPGSGRMAPASLRAWCGC